MNNLPASQFHTIILVDDNYIDNFVHRRLLKRLNIGKKYFEFSSSIQAMAYLKSFKNFYEKTSPDFIDIILLDMDMPFMNAWQFIEALKIICAGRIIQTKIIVVSNTCNNEEIERIYSEKLFSGFISKPLDQDKLLAFLQTLAI